MTLQLLDAAGAGKLRERLNIDGAFRLVARDMTLNLAVEDDGEARLLKFRNGGLRAIDRFVPLTEPVDVTIKGDGAFWQKLLSPAPPPRFQNLYAGVRAGTCEVSGNGELYNAYFAAISRLTEVMRELQSQGGL